MGPPLYQEDKKREEKGTENLTKNRERTDGMDPHGFVGGQHP